MEIYEGVKEAKITALKEIVEANDGNPILVFYNFKHDKDRIKKAFQEARELQNSADIRAWNEGKVKLLIAHPASAGYGLNLQALKQKENGQEAMINAVKLLVEKEIENEIKEVTEIHSMC